MPWTMRLAVIGSMLASACARGAGEAPPEPMHDETGAPVLATLHTKDSELTITGHGGEVRYSLLDVEGKRHDDLTLEEVLAYDPNLYEVVKFAMANRVPSLSEAGAKPASAGVVDARVHEHPPPGAQVDSRVNALMSNPALRSR